MGRVLTRARLNSASSPSLFVDSAVAAAGVTGESSRQAIQAAPGKAVEGVSPVHADGMAYGVGDLLFGFC